MPVGQLRRLSDEPEADLIDEDEGPAARMTWLGDLLCGLGCNAVDETERPRSMSF